MISYFGFFDLPEHFHLDASDLKAKYFRILRESHPDHHTGNQVHYKDALLRTSLNNEAYKCLSDPWLRADHLLRCAGRSFPETLPPDFLMEMMDINEQIDELRSGQDAVFLEKLQKMVRDLMSDLESEFDELTRQADAEKDGAKKPFSEIHQLLLKRKYLLRLQDTLATFALPESF